MGFYPNKQKSSVDLYGGLALSGVSVTSSAAELNLVDGVSAPSANGLGLFRVARATYDFAVNGGAISAISSGVTIPDNAIVCGGFVDVVTTCTSAGADAGTMAIHVQGANDIVSAVAISAATDWDAGLHAIVPKANTPESTGIKLTAARTITSNRPARLVNLYIPAMEQGNLCARHAIDSHFGLPVTREDYRCHCRICCGCSCDCSHVWTACTHRQNLHAMNNHVTIDRVDCAYTIKGNIFVNFVSSPRGQAIHANSPRACTNRIAVIVSTT